MTATIAEIMERLPAAFLVPDGGGIEAVIHFKFTGAEAGEWNAVTRGQDCVVAPGIPRTKPTISVAADSADFIDVATGKLDGMAAYMTGRIRVTGNLAMVPKILALFRPPGP